jgi:hypothetical protein
VTALRAIAALLMVSCVGEEVDERWECAIVVGHAEGAEWGVVDSCGLPDPFEVEVLLRRCDVESAPEICQVYCEPTFVPCVGPDRDR